MTDRPTRDTHPTPETVWECDNMADAALVKSLLEDAQIPCVIAGAHDGLLGPLSARIQVPSTRAEDARALLTKALATP